MRKWLLLRYIFIVFTIPVSLYVVFLLFILTKDPAWTTHIGTFGDSFGALNTLFTGLTFSGLVITILLQRDALAVQKEDLLESRQQFKRSAEAQEMTAQLTAFSQLISEYDQNIKILEMQLVDAQTTKSPTSTQALFDTLSPGSYTKHLESELDRVRGKRKRIIEKLETFLDVTKE